MKTANRFSIEYGLAGSERERELSIACHSGCRQPISFSFCVLKSEAMKIFPPSRLAFFLAGATVTAFLISALHAATAKQQAVLAPVMALFDGMAKRDAGAIRITLLAGGMMVLMRQGKPTQMTFEDFADRVARPGTTHMEERIHHPLVRVDHDLAVVWAPFEFLVDGKVDHCGTDLFNLIRTDGKWLIASIADTGRNNCSVN
jgi:Putative lumazine-binding